MAQSEAARGQMRPQSRVMVAAQSRVKAARGRQNCLKISFSKYSLVICLFIGFWGPTLVLKYENTARFFLLANE